MSSAGAMSASPLPPAAFTWVLRLELRSLCLQGKHFGLSHSLCFPAVCVCVCVSRAQAGYVGEAVLEPTPKHWASRRGLAPLAGFLLSRAVLAQLMPPTPRDP